MRVRVLLCLLPSLLMVLMSAALPAPGSAASATDSGSAADGIDRTRRKVIRPVTERGRPVDGWDVTREGGRVDCLTQSVSAVDGGINFCTPAAAYLPSCWQSRNQTVLCLRDIWSRDLIRVRYRRTFPVSEPVPDPVPQGLVLTDRMRCAIRIGGAYAPPPGHPKWVAYFSCKRGTVFGPPNGDGIDQSRPVWRVQMLRNDGTWVTKRVKRALYVGTAR